MNCETAVQEHFNCKKARTSKFDVPTTLFKGLECSGSAAGGHVGAHFGCLEAKLELRRPSYAAWTVNLGPRGAKLRLECGLEGQVGS